MHKTYTSLDGARFDVKQSFIPDDVAWESQFDNALEELPTPALPFDYWRKIIAEYETYEKNNQDTTETRDLEVNLKEEVDRLAEETKLQENMMSRISSRLMNSGAETKGMEREGTAPAQQPRSGSVTGSASETTSDQEVALNRMTMITGAPADRCRSLLASVGWDLQRAVQEFYETSDG